MTFFKITMFAFLITHLNQQQFSFINLQKIQVLIEREANRFDNHVLSTTFKIFQFSKGV